MEDFKFTTIQESDEILSGIYDSSSQLANRDGNVIERTEFIIDTLLNTLPVRAEQSDSHTVSEGTYSYFSIQLFDVDGNPYASNTIDITSATLTLEKSTLGGAFSVVGITQPVLAKGLGHIDTSILFKVDEWQPDDLYKLSLSGITVTNGSVHTLQHFTWNNMVSLVNDIDAEVDTILSVLTFPTVDNIGDTKVAEVIGTKGDTVTGTSIISRIKQAIAQLVLVLADTLTIKTETNKIAGEVTKTGLIKTETDKIPATIVKVDVIKSKTDNLPSDPADQSLIDAKLGLITDTAGDQTLLGYQNSLYQHVHNQARVYPSLANGIVVTGGAAIWTLGNFIEIVPTNTITSMFDIHYINFEEASATDSYELVLYSGLGGSEVEIGRVRTSRETANSGIANVPIQIPAQMNNTRISAKLASKSGGSDTVTISLYYHIYG